MRRILIALSAALVGVECTDPDLHPTAIRQVRPSQTSIAPDLDTEINLLLGLLDNGLRTAAHSRWDDVKRELTQTPNGTPPDESKGPAKAARQMLVELVQWIESKSANLNPSSGETKSHLAARIVLDMSLYVYVGPATPPPNVAPTSEMAVAVVQPTAQTTIQTESRHAAAAFPAGAVDEPTVVVVAQETRSYPANCSGPLGTHLCQYPEFYQFNVFPDVKLNVPARVGVCHVDAGSSRRPLAPDRFRLAHDLPSDARNYTTGATQVDGIEILPRADVHDIIDCATVGAHPAAVSVLEQGYGGEAMFFSTFAPVDPLGLPDLQVAPGSFNLQESELFRGEGVDVDAFAVINIGSATAGSFGTALYLSSDTTITTADAQLGSAGGTTQLVPGDTARYGALHVSLGTLAPGTYYVGVLVDTSGAVAESDATNNFVSVKITVNDPTPTYTVTDLGTLGGLHATLGFITDQGLIVGFSDLPGSPLNHAFKWTGGPLQDINPAGYEESFARGANNLGEIVGWGNVAGGDTIPLFWDVNNSARDLGSLSGFQGALAAAINDIGDIVGRTLFKSDPAFPEPNFEGESRALYWPARGGVVDLGAFGGINAALSSIANNGRVAGGRNFGLQRFTSAIVLANPLGTPTDIGNLGDNSSVHIGGGAQATVVTSAGVVAGISGFYPDDPACEVPQDPALPTLRGCEHGFVWSQRRGMTDIGTLAGGLNSQARGLNIHGFVVGRSETQPFGPARAIVWNRAVGMRQLPNPPGNVRASLALRINAAGVIVGWAKFPSGTPAGPAQHVIVWTPVH